MKANNNNAARFTCTRPYASNDRDWVSGDVAVFRLGDFTWTRVEGDTEKTYKTAREAFAGVAAPTRPNGGFDYDTYAATAAADAAAYAVALAEFKATAKASA